MEAFPAYLILSKNSVAFRIFGGIQFLFFSRCFVKATLQVSFVAFSLGKRRMPLCGARILTHPSEAKNEEVGEKTEMEEDWMGMQKEKTHDRSGELGDEKRAEEQKER